MRFLRQTLAAVLPVIAAEIAGRWREHARAEAVVQNALRQYVLGYAVQTARELVLSLTPEQFCVIVGCLNERQRKTLQEFMHIMLQEERDEPPCEKRSPHSHCSP